jgi:hypothetical protein
MRIELVSGAKSLSVEIGEADFNAGRNGTLPAILQQPEFNRTLCQKQTKKAWAHRYPRCCASAPDITSKASFS